MVCIQHTHTLTCFSFYYAFLSIRSHRFIATCFWVFQKSLQVRLRLSLLALLKSLGFSHRCRPRQGLLSKLSLARLQTTWPHQGTGNPLNYWLLILWENLREWDLIIRRVKRIQSGGIYMLHHFVFSSCRAWGTNWRSVQVDYSSDRTMRDCNECWLQCPGSFSILIWSHKLSTDLNSGHGQLKVSYCG